MHFLLATFLFTPYIDEVAFDICILMFMYYRLARKEENEMESRFGDQYVTYRQQVPMFRPRLVTAWRTAKASSRVEKA